MQHVTNFKITGMQMDPSISAFDSKYSYKNMNIRILSKTEEGIVLSAVNEQGTLPVKFVDSENNDVELEGTIIGQTSIDDELILFTTNNEGKDCIYKARLFENAAKMFEDNEKWLLEKLYEGNLNFSFSHPIDCFPYYENQNIKKVYWVDGINQPRVINVVMGAEQLKNLIFDFVPEITADTQEIVEINKVYNGGEFTPGTIQFVFCYVNIFGNELSPFYISDLQYINHENRGESPDKVVPISFSINIFNLNNTYSKIRIYSIHRDYKDGTPNYSFLEYNYNNDISEQELKYLKLSSEYLPYIKYNNEHSKIWIDQYYCGVYSNANGTTAIDGLYPNNTAKKLKLLSDSNEMLKYINDHIRIRVIPKDSTYSNLTVFGISEFDELLNSYNVHSDVKEITTSFRESVDAEGLGYWYRYMMQFNILISTGHRFWEDFENNFSIYLVDDSEIPYLEYKFTCDFITPVFYIEFRDDIEYSNMHIYATNNTEDTLIYISDTNELYKTNIFITDKIGYITIPVIYADLKINVDNGLYYDHLTQKILNNDQSLITVEGNYMTVLYSNNNTKSSNSILLKTVNNYAITPATIAAKDNTLFFGNYKILNTIIDKAIEADIKRYADDIEFCRDYNKTIPLPEIVQDEDGLKYLYKNQLDSSSSKLKHFKYDEWYRFGLRLIDKYGNSTVVYLGDKKNNKSVWYDKGNSCIQVPYAKLQLDEDIVSNLKNNNIIKIQPLIVYPDIYERRGICQGAICSTIYNEKDRKDGTVYTQASWIHRPINPYSNPTDGIFKNSVGPGITEVGALPKYLHGDILSDSKDSSCEIFLSNYITDANIHYFIDQNTVTLHSPDLEFNDELKSYNFKNCKLRIVGIIPIQSNSAYRNWQYEGSVGTHGWYIYDTDSNTNQTKKIDTTKFTNKEFSNTGALLWNRAAFRKMISDNIFFAGANAYYINNDVSKRNYMSYPYSTFELVFAYPIFLFHPSSYITNQTTDGGNTQFTAYNQTTAKITNKLISNLQYSHCSWYLPEDKYCNIDINVPLLYDYTTVSGDKFTTNNGDKWYYGNINKDQNVDIDGLYSNVVNIKTTTEFVNDSHNAKLTVVGAITRPMTSKLLDDLKTEQLSAYGSTVEFNQIGLKDPYVGIDFEGFYEYDNKYEADIFKYLSKQYNPVHIEYNSTPHCVLNLKNKNSKIKILPKIGMGTDYSNTYKTSVDTIEQESIEFAWGNSSLFPKYKYNEEETTVSDYGFVYLGELYNDNASLAYKKPENLVWLPGGEEININVSNTLVWSSGDTYLQRYDNLKTYSPTVNNINGVVDILSFMCETRINLDGRYDRNRGQSDNTIMSPSNFNLINSAYTQDNNYYTYNYLEYKKRNVEDAFNQISWGLTKVPGSDIDNWLNVNLINVLNLDGSKGRIHKLDLVNNMLVSFQENAISEIMYNTRSQISTSEGTPVELANSGKVDGYRILSSRGVYSKNHVLNTGNNLYFIDSSNHELYSVLDTSKSISSAYRISSWLNNISKSEWKPNNYGDSWKLQYDFKEQDVYIINSKECLGLSEILGSAQSFYNYEGVDCIFNIEESTYCIKDNKIYKMHAGEYNTFFGTKKPYYLEYVVNDNPNVTKIFDSVEYVGDTFKLQNGNWKLDYENTFDKIEVSNEYQQGEKFIHTEAGGIHTYTDLKRKYRQWRALLPRQEGTRNRIVNPWIKLKISKEHVDNERTVLHFLNVKYSTIP